MASFKLKFAPSANKDKKGTLYFQIIHRRISGTVYTGYHLHPDEWDKQTSSIRIAGTPERQAWLRLQASKLQWDIRQLSAVITEKENSGVEYTTADIVSSYKQLPPCQTWFDFIRGMITLKTKIGRLGTAKTYQAALSSFVRFRSGEDLTPDDLTSEIISTYEAWLKSCGLKRNSSSCYLRTLRTLYFKAVAMRLTTNKDIFCHVFTGFAKTSKRALPVVSIQAIRTLKLSEGSPLAFARDIFMLSLYLQGMSFIDMAYLRKSDIRNGQLQYSRRKTGQTLTIRWEPAMQAIVDEYARHTTDSPYLLPIITIQNGTERLQYEKMEHNINRNLKKIGIMANLPIPLTTYVARHSWASTMRDMGFDLSIISTGLGHDNLKTTQIYLSTIDTTTLAQANQKMICKILE